MSLGETAPLRNVRLKYLAHVTTHSRGGDATLVAVQLTTKVTNALKTAKIRNSGADATTP
jgi:hypothetical protein